MSEELSFSGEDVADTGLEKLWVLNDSHSESGILENAEQLLADLPKLGEIAARTRVTEILPEYRPIGVSTPSLGSAPEIVEARTKVQGATEG